MPAQKHFSCGTHHLNGWKQTSSQPIIWPFQKNSQLQLRTPLPTNIEQPRILAHLQQKLNRCLSQHTIFAIWNSGSQLYRQKCLPHQSYWVLNVYSSNSGRQIHFIHTRISPKSQIYQKPQFHLPRYSRDYLYIISAAVVPDRLWRKRSFQNKTEAIPINEFRVALWWFFLARGLQVLRNHSTLSEFHIWVHRF